MSQGIEFFDESGNRVWSSEGGAVTLIDSVSVDTATAATVVRTYPNLVGYTVTVYPEPALESRQIIPYHFSSSTTGVTVTIDYTLGYPRVTLDWSATTIAMQFNMHTMVAVPPPSSSSYGIEVYSASGELALNEYSDSVSYVGKAALVSRRSNRDVFYDISGVMLDTPYYVSYDNAVTFTTTGLGATPGSQPLFFVHSTAPFGVVNIQWTGTAWAIELLMDVAADYGAYTPEVYVLLRNVSSPSSDLHGARVWDASGNLVFDAGRRPLQAKGFVAIPEATLHHDPSACPTGASSSTAVTGVVKPAVLATVPQYGLFNSNLILPATTDRISGAVHMLATPSGFVNTTNGAIFYPSGSSVCGTIYAMANRRAWNTLELPVIEGADYD